MNSNSQDHSVAQPRPPAEPHTITGYDGRSVIEEAWDRQLSRASPAGGSSTSSTARRSTAAASPRTTSPGCPRLLLAEDVLRYAEDGVRELRADFQALREHPAVLEAQKRPRPTSPVAERFVQKVAECRQALARDAVMENRI